MTGGPIDEIGAVVYIGAGMMGCVNSLVASVSGYDVVLHDASPDTLGTVAERHEGIGAFLVGSGCCTADQLAAAREPEDPPTTATQLRRNVLGKLLVAQTRMLGGSLNVPWDPPGADASPEQQQLFADYCRTKIGILRDFADDLSYIRTPDCP